METDDENVESAENPYAAPKVESTSRRTSSLAATILVALAIPATFATFFCTCTLTGAAGTAIGGLGSAFSAFSHIAGLVVGVVAARTVLARMRQLEASVKRRSRDV